MESQGKVMENDHNVKEFLLLHALNNSVKLHL